MMLGTTPTLRTAAIGCRLQLSLITPCSYHTSQLAQNTKLRNLHRRVVPVPRTKAVFQQPSRCSIRHEYSLSNSPSTPPQSNPANANFNTSASHLDWNTFFRLRKTRRLYQLVSSAGTGIGGFVSGAQVLTQTDMDSLVAQIPLDPFITLGLITFTCGGTGWLLGPLLGTAVFNLRNRRHKVQMDEKEKEFFKRVRKYRVDPSASSMANPVPDYYGEKISSVAGYRQWLKDCRAFNRKRRTYLK